MHHPSALTSETRAMALEAMSDPTGLDVLVVGGGVTGAGIALDAATRGLRTGIIEMQDWASGTSARSSRLVHGGLRYLYQLDFPLVAEALKERGRLLHTIAPHLVTAQPFLWPLHTPVIERAYSAIGIGAYDALAAVGSRETGAAVPRQKHYGRAGVARLFPDVRPEGMRGAIRFYDARVDDARLVIDLVRTASGYGAYAASRTQLVEVTRGADGRVDGAVIEDLTSGEQRRVRASRVILATGVWTEETQALAGEQGLSVLASKGIHLLFPKDRIKGSTGLFLRTEKSVLFIIPWQRYWVIGTTDTPWDEPVRHPVPTSADIDYVLEHANAVLSSDLTRADIIGTYAGLRPLLQPTAAKGSSAKVSREHTVLEVAPGLISIAGGKLTTYRAMAQDAVDFALGPETSKELPSVTARTPLVGAEGYPAARRAFARVATERGWSDDLVDHLLSRYGSEVFELLRLIEEDPSLAEPIPSAPPYLRAEVAWAIRMEGALHLEDILMHRIRLDQEHRDRGVSALADIAEIAAPLLGWDAATAQAEQQNWRDQVAAEQAAEATDNDAAAARARLQAPDLIPVHVPIP
ncbi:glycerol-3-phosphate dehydrogenase/oxidase [Granulicoccus phenolivorans]|uniref:glycerol-3-phosphate dehydrogenase/oxidase n=1 Tax=Granulicoccus phenolivorans TaxID=266854 RepID=UPI00041284AB|nr:glycerol-3-phosphate dehydrogenase/oxidase [Granulicoccus phenolivorans]